LATSLEGFVVLFLFLFCLENINKTLHLHHLRVQIFPVWVGCSKEEKLLLLQPWCSLTVFLAPGNILLLLVLGIFKHVSLFFSFSWKIYKFKKKGLWSLWILSFDSGKSWIFCVNCGLCWVFLFGGNAGCNLQFSIDFCGEN